MQNTMHKRYQPVIHMSILKNDKTHTYSVDHMTILVFHQSVVILACYEYMDIGLHIQGTGMANCLV